MRGPSHRGKRGKSQTSTGARGGGAGLPDAPKQHKKASTKRRTNRRPARGSGRLIPGRAGTRRQRTAKIAATPIKLEEMAEGAEMVPMTPREEPGTTVAKAQEMAKAGPKTGRKKTLSQKLSLIHI